MGHFQRQSFRLGSGTKLPMQLFEPRTHHIILELDMPMHFKQQRKSVRSLNLLEMFRGDFSLGTKVLVKENEDGGDDREKCTKSKHNKVSNTLG